MEKEKGIIKVTDEKGNTINMKGRIEAYIVRDVEKDGILGPPAIKNLDKNWFKKKVLLVLIDEKA